MNLQSVKIYKPDKKGILRLVRVISSKEVMRLADEKFSNKQKWRKQNAKS
jgi:hypothetical protein